MLGPAGPLGPPLGPPLLLTLLLLCLVDAADEPAPREFLPMGCGYSYFGDRIIGGMEAEKKKWPWQASVQNNEVHLCGGSLVDSMWVLTSANCVNIKGNFSVLLGTPWLDTIERGEALRVSVDQVVIHPNYQEIRYWSWIGREHNVALLKLSEKVKYTEFIAPVCLPSTTFQVGAGSYCWVAGWGQYKIGPPEHVTTSFNLLEAEIKILNNDICDTLFHDISEVPSIVRIITPSMLCSDYSRGKDFCSKDDGSPLVCEIDNTWFQAGIVSWSLGCAHLETPGVYSRVSKYSIWIQREMAGLNYAVSTLRVSSWLTALSLILPISLTIAL